MDTLTSASVQATREIEALGLASPPVGWRAVRERSDWHNDASVTVFRFQPGEYQLGAPHLSVVLDRTGTVLGYTCMTRPPYPQVPVPADSAAREASSAFLRHADPAWAAGLTEQWIARHDEQVRDQEGTLTIAGAKVKHRHADGSYAWVVIDQAGHVVTYERDVLWDSAASRRSTRMWLHDCWIAAFDGTGPQPSAPYALI